MAGGDVLVSGNVNVPDVTAFDDPNGDQDANSWETTMWNVLMVGYWVCVAIPLVFLCAGIVAAFGDIVARQSDGPHQWDNYPLPPPSQRTAS
jgi:hypothetical protein